MNLRIIHGWRDLAPEDRGAAVALGNFDGVHRGHQQVIGQAQAAAVALNVPSAVVSFEPHPRRWFQPDAEPFRVMSVGQMARALDDLGVDRLYVLPFDAEMAEMTDEAFARDVLAGGDRAQAAQGAIAQTNGLGSRHVAVGFDVTFGKGRTGSPQAMRGYGARFGFTVSVAAAFTDPGGLKLSSSAVRDALKVGDMAGAAAILGRPFAIEGEVIHGDKRGRTIGVPTANVALGDYVRPAYGVYATRTRLPDGRLIDGVANLGVRPMFETPEPLLEVWLFDFDGDLYGQTVETQLIAYLRGERKLDGLDALKTQIAADAAAARAALA